MRKTIVASYKEAPNVTVRDFSSHFDHTTCIIENGICFRYDTNIFRGLELGRSMRLLYYKLHGWDFLGLAYDDL